MIEVNVHKLDNGLRLLHHYNASTRMVAVNTLFDVGSRDEDIRHTGLAHLMEHLMFTGSAHAPSFDSELQAAGGESNAWTSFDVTNFYEILPAHNIETALWLESDRIANLNLNEESIALQKSVVVEEFKQRSINQPYGDVMHLLHGEAYRVHSYKWPAIGLNVEDIEAVDPEVVLDFYKKHYMINNAVMCIAGNVEFERAVELVEKWFGDFPMIAVPQRNIPAEPPQTSLRLVEHHASVPQNIIFRAYHMCERLSPDFQATDLLSDVLANGTSSRFYRNIVANTRQFTELDASVGGYADPSLFYIRGVLRDGVTFDEAEATIDNELEQLLVHGVSDYEVEKCTNKFLATDTFENLGYAAKASRLCNYELMSSAHDINNEVGKYRAVTPAKILQVAERIFKKENCTTLHYGPNV